MQASAAAAAAAEMLLLLLLRLRVQLQQPLRHCCRKCDNLATNMRWLPGGGGAGEVELPPKEDITQCICVGASEVMGGYSQHMHGCICQRSTKMRQSDAQAEAQAAARAAPTHTRACPSPPPLPEQTYCRFQLPTANWCRCSALIPSVQSPLLAAPAFAPFVKLPQQLEHRKKCAFMASNSKVFKISTFHALCRLPQTQATEPSHFFVILRSPDTL